MDVIIQSFVVKEPQSSPLQQAEHSGDDTTDPERSVGREVQAAGLAGLRALGAAAAGGGCRARATRGRLVAAAGELALDHAVRAGLGFEGCAVGVDVGGGLEVERAAVVLQGGELDAVE